MLLEVHPFAWDLSLCKSRRRTFLRNRFVLAMLELLLVSIDRAVQKIFR